MPLSQHPFMTPLGDKNAMVIERILRRRSGSTKGKAGLTLADFPRDSGATTSNPVHHWFGR